jgi:hypothetical protein
MRRLVIALTALLFAAGVVVVGGYLFVFGATADRAARLAPADTTVYVTVYLNPSTGQRMNLSDVLVKLPGFGDRATIGTNLDELVQKLFARAGVDYRSDLKPWLGDQVALAVGPLSPSGGAPGAAGEALIIADVKDEALTRQAIDRLATQSGACPTTPKEEKYQGVDLITTCGSQAVTYAFVNRTLLASSNASRVRAAIDVAQGRASSLADDRRFRDAIGALPPDYLAAAYLDLAALARASGTAQQLAGYTSAGLALVAEPGGLHLVGRAPFTATAADASARANFALSSEPSSLPGWMPEGTDAELVFFGAREALAEVESRLGSVPGGQSAAQALTQLRALAALGLGIDIDRDVLPLFDREAAVAVQGLGGSPHAELLLRPSDAKGAEALLSRVTEALRGRGSTVTTTQAQGVTVTTAALPQIGSVSYATTDGVVILSLNADDVGAALAAHASGNSLADSTGYKQTFALAGARGGNELYLNAAPAIAFLQALGVVGDLSGDVHDMLTHAGAIGFTAPARNDAIEFHAVVTVH